MHIASIFTHVVLEMCKNKKLRYWFEATLAQETRIGYISNTHGLSRRSLRWSWNEAVTIKPDTASWCARNSREKRYSNWFYLRVIDYKRTDTSLYSTKSWSWIRSLRQFRWFALKYFFGLYFKYFINLKTLELGWHCPRCPPWLRAWWQPYADCRLQTSAGIRD